MKVELLNMKKTYGNQRVFEDFCIEIKSGEMVSVTGKSGAGKTTLINILGLIEQFDEGRILYNGHEIKSNKQKRNLLGSEIGFVFQNYGLIDNETIYDNLKLVKCLQGKSKSSLLRLMTDALEKVELSNSFLNKKVFECSGGEQQRVGIAKLLLKDCKIIFADEPTASLDYENKAGILAHLTSLNALGKTVVIVSHDEDVCSFCHRVVTIKS